VKSAKLGASLVVLFTKYNQNYQMEDKTGGSCSMNGEK
jgi:hypothetical protein